VSEGRLSNEMDSERLEGSKKNLVVGQRSQGPGHHGWSD
jgi:hypothetical protein